MDELLTIESVRYRPAEVLFPQYEQIKADATALAEHIREVEVTEENVKAVKKDLAKVRKIVTELNNRRKVVKAEILKDYNTFEAQIKEIDFIISEAENEVRVQTKALEEEERERKRLLIRDIWDKRINQYSIVSFGDYFDRWLQPAHLNKTTSMKSIESDMVDWLETRQKDIETLKAMGNDYLAEYVECLDITDAIQSVNRRKEINMIIQEDSESEDTATFIVFGMKDIKFTEALLKENEINYRRNK